MKTLTARQFGPLAEALFDAFRSVNDLDRLLHTLDPPRRFDEFTSQTKSLKENAYDIVGKAFEGGWAMPLLEAARAAQPDNPLLRDLWDKLPEGGAEVAESAAQRPDRPSLVCGRAAQWGEVCQAAPAIKHQLILVGGAAGQAPIHFRDRIHVHLTTDPKRSMVAVHWPKRPARAGAFYEALGLALNVPAPLLADEAVAKDKVREAIGQRLAAQNLVLLHDVITLKFSDERLFKYYTEWLPELLQNLPNTGKVKCVQPIEWPTESNWQKLGLDNALEDPNSRESALEFIKRLKTAKSPVLPVVEIDELLNLTEKELNDFVENSGLEDPQQAALRGAIQSVPPVSVKIFETIDANWSEVETAP